MFEQLTLWWIPDHLSKYPSLIITLVYILTPNSMTEQSTISSVSEFCPAYQLLKKIVAVYKLSETMVLLV